MGHGNRVHAPDEYLVIEPANPTRGELTELRPGVLAAVGGLLERGALFGLFNGSHTPT